MHDTTPPSLKAQTADVIVVDDNVRLSHELFLVFQAAGWSVRCADDGQDLRVQMAFKEAAIVVLDLNLPGEDGISLCRWLRKTHPRVGIVLLTARVMGSERTEGYVAGADVYLTKPTRPAELLAVAGNLWQRTHLGVGLVEGSTPLTWSLHIKALRLLSPQLDMLSLTPSECALLQGLASVNGLCTYDQLIAKISHVSQSYDVDKARLEVVVSRLRSKLAAFQTNGFQIMTAHGLGYSLTLPLAIKA